MSGAEEFVSQEQFNKLQSEVEAYTAVIDAAKMADFNKRLRHVKKYLKKSSEESSQQTQENSKIEEEPAAPVLSDEYKQRIQAIEARLTEMDSTNFVFSTEIDEEKVQAALLLISKEKDRAREYNEYRRDELEKFQGSVDEIKASIDREGIAKLKMDIHKIKKIVKKYKSMMGDRDRNEEEEEEEEDKADVPSDDDISRAEKYVKDVEYLIQNVKPAEVDPEVLEMLENLVNSLQKLHTHLAESVKGLEPLNQKIEEGVAANTREIEDLSKKAQESKQEEEQALDTLKKAIEQAVHANERQNTPVIQVNKDDTEISEIMKQIEELTKKSKEISIPEPVVKSENAGFEPKLVFILIAVAFLLGFIFRSQKKCE